MAGRHERRKTPRYGVMLMGVILAAAFCFSAYKVIFWFLTARQE